MATRKKYRGRTGRKVLMEQVDWVRKMSRIPALHFEPRNTLFSVLPVGHAFEPVGGADHFRVDGLDFFFFLFLFIFRGESLLQCFSSTDNTNVNIARTTLDFRY